MRALLTAVAVVVPALFVGCSQPVTPTGPTLSGENATSTASPGTVAALRREEVPFKGSLEGVVTRRTPLTPPLVSLLVEGTGHATHLGRFTLENPYVANTAVTIRTTTGSFEFTAANGDTLIAETTGRFSPTADNPRVLLGVETATITGGTGRFADSTGSFTVERFLDLDTFLVTGSFEGTISSPGAGNP